MNENFREKIRDAVNKFEQDQSDPRLLVIGATGVGKSSLINIIFGRKLHEVNTIISTTRSFSTHAYEIDPGQRILITDSPGYGEVGYDSQYSREIVEEAKNSDAVTLVLKADDKGYERDLKIIGVAGEDPGFSLEKPLLISLNQIDKIKPSREWNPPYHLHGGVSESDSEKVRNIKEKIKVVKSQFQSVVGSREVIIVATMSDPDEGATFGIDQFKLHLFKVLPDANRFRFARMVKLAKNASQEVIEELDKEAGYVIAAAATAAAGAVAFNPVPASDFLVLAPFQISMIIKIGSIYGKTVDGERALEVISALGAGFAARSIFQGVISLMPGIKNILGPPYAAAATHGMGVAARAYFKNQVVPSVKDIQEEIQRELKKRGG